MILPTSRKIVALGPGGILCGQSDPSSTCVFSRIIGQYQQGRATYNISALEFTPNLETNVLHMLGEPEPGNDIILYPVPFSAADGISWKGQSLSTNVGADDDLNEKLTKLADDLEASGMTTWSYSSDGLSDDWTGDDAYDRVSLRKQYFGIVPEPGGAF